MPETLINGRIVTNYSKEEVDSLSTLRILWDPKLRQLPSTAEFEKYFVEFSDNITPTYLASNQVYNRKGEELPEPSNLEGWLSSEILSVRCPHIPTACQMATLVRELKYQKDSTGGIIYCIVRNTHIGLFIVNSKVVKFIT